jgi:predicted DNA binding CopG/RHH family protein
MNEKIVTIRMNNEDYEKLKENADKIGISVASFIRFCLFKNLEVTKNDEQ